MALLLGERDLCRAALLLGERDLLFVSVIRSGYSFQLYVSYCYLRATEQELCHSCLGDGFSAVHGFPVLLALHRHDAQRGGVGSTAVPKSMILGTYITRRCIEFNADVGRVDIAIEYRLCVRVSPALSTGCHKRTGRHCSCGRTQSNASNASTLVHPYFARRRHSHHVYSTLALSRGCCYSRYLTPRKELT